MLRHFCPDDHYPSAFGSSCTSIFFGLHHVTLDLFCPEKCIHFGVADDDGGGDDDDDTAATAAAACAAIAADSTAAARSVATEPTSSLAPRREALSKLPPSLLVIGVILPCTDPPVKLCVQAVVKLNCCAALLPHRKSH